MTWFRYDEGCRYHEILLFRYSDISLSRHDVITPFLRKITKKFLCRKVFPLRFPFARRAWISFCFLFSLFLLSCASFQIKSLSLQRNWGQRVSFPKFICSISSRTATSKRDLWANLISVGAAPIECRLLHRILEVVADLWGVWRVCTLIMPVSLCRCHSEIGNSAQNL